MPSFAPRYTVTTGPLPPDSIARAAHAWRTAVDRELGKPVSGSLVLIAGTTAIGAAVGAIPMISGAPYVTAAPLALGAIGAVLALLVQLRARDVRRAMEARVRELEAGMEATAHSLLLDGPHRFIPHEHGVLAVVQLDETHCVTLDISSVADDPRDAPVNAALKAGSMPSRWQWFETPQGEILDFTMSGDTVVPVIGDEGWDDDEHGVVARVVDAMPSDGYVATLDFVSLVPRQGEAN